MNPCRTSFPDLREAGETSHEEETWDGTERRGKGTSLEQTVTEISALGGDKTVCGHFPTLSDNSFLNNNKGLPRNYGGSPRISRRSIS